MFKNNSSVWQDESGQGATAIALLFCILLVVVLVCAVVLAPAIGDVIEEFNSSMIILGAV